MSHAVTLVARIKAEVIDNINEQQSKQMLAMAKESCEAYYTHTFANTDTSNAQPQDNEEKSNWLTEIILRGETERTARSFKTHEVNNKQQGILVITRQIPR